MKITYKVEEQTKCTAEIIAYLHQVWLDGEEGRPIQANPFYSRAKLITPAIVEMVIRSLEDIFLFELEKYRAYHNNAQGISAGEILIPPGFDKLPFEQQFAVVERIDEICQKYKMDEATEPTPIPETTIIYYDC